MKNGQKVNDTLLSRVSSIKGGGGLEANLKEFIKESFYAQNEIYNLNAAFEQSVKDFHRNDIESQIIIGGSEISVSVQNNIEHLKNTFNVLDVSENLRDNIIANLNQGGNTYAALALLRVYLISGLDIYSQEKRTLWKFTKTAENRVTFENKFIINGFYTAETKQLQKKTTDYLECHTTFDFVWNDAEQDISIENVEVKLNPLGEFKESSQLKKGCLDGIHARKISDVNKKILISAFFTSVGLLSITILTLDLYKKLDLNISEDSNNTLFALAVVIFFISASLFCAYLVNKDCQKSDHKDVIKDIERGNIPKYIEEKIDVMTVDDIFKSFVQYTQDEIKKEELAKAPVTEKIGTAVNGVSLECQIQHSESADSL
jgi:hypothetical protein